MKNNTILITGGAGYIGSKLAKMFLDASHRVIIVDNLHSGLLSNLPKETVFYNADILSGEIETIIKNEKPSVIYHLAAHKSVNESVKDPEGFRRTNVDGSKHVIDIAHANGVRKIIFTSTAGVYGDATVNQLQSENDPIRPSSPYAQTKYETEQYLLALNNDGMNNIVLRFANVYGPGGESEYKSVINIFVSQILKNEAITVYGSGMQSRDFIFIDDLIDACVRCQEVSTPTNIKPIFNISTGKSSSIVDTLRYITDLTNTHPVVHVDKHAFSGQQSSVLNPKQARTHLGWVANTNLKQGIQQTITHYKKQL